MLLWQQYLPYIPYHLLDFEFLNHTRPVQKSSIPRQSSTSVIVSILSLQYYMLYCSLLNLFGAVATVLPYPSYCCCS